MNKDKEIDEFFSRFDSDKSKEEAEISQIQFRIEQALEELSEVTNMIQNLPDENKAKDLVDEKNFKSGAVTDAKFTLEKLKIEREKLKKEMVK